MRIRAVAAAARGLVERAGRSGCYRLSAKARQPCSLGEVTQAVGADPAAIQSRASSNSVQNQLQSHVAEGLEPRPRVGWRTGGPAPGAPASPCSERESLRC